ncbi:MAG: CDP-alcohol phosphatidyltransferase family protein [Pseudomonadota bacterium]
MLDGKMRVVIDPPLNAFGKRLAAMGLTADGVTLLGLGFGLLCGALIGLGAYGWALVFLILSRLADGLDGAVARATQKTDRGGYLDIVCDYAFYAAVPLGFAIADPAANAIAACVLLFAFYINGGSFLGYAILAEKHQMTTELRGSKSLYFTGGLAEGTETIAVFALACLVPAWFPWLAYGFAAITLITAVSRIIMAWQTFDPDSA